MLTYQELQDNIDSAYDYRKRRHEDWTANYHLWRDKVITNRLTQRQSVNVPLMKANLSTLKANIARIADLDFEQLDNDKQAELFFNEYWAWTAKENHLGVIDHVDTMQQLLYGRSFIKLNIVDGMIKLTVEDPQDILVDRFTDPIDLETARYVIHSNIFKTLDDILNDESYSAEAKRDLKGFYGTKLGLIKSEENAEMMRERNERLGEMGLDDVDHPLLGATYVMLNEQVVKEWDKGEKEMAKQVYTTADNVILRQRSLKKVLNIDFYPLVTWASDVEKTDFWSDGKADTIRTPNQVANVWLSQLVENRTMRNFGMQFYDSTVGEGWTPQGYTPGPFAFFPLPGKPADMLQRVEVPELSESLDEMQYLVQMTESATAATGIEKGTGADEAITLGEVQLRSAKSMTRISDISALKLIRDEQLGDKFQKLANANADKLEPVKLYKKSNQDNYFPKEVKPSEWKTKSGYRVRVVSKEQKEGEALDQVQKLRLAVQEFPQNQPIREIYQEKILSLAQLTPDEMKRVTDFEEQSQMHLQQQAQAQQMQLQAPQEPQGPSIMDSLLASQAQALNV
jgi:hypothetical protein